MVELAIGHRDAGEGASLVEGFAHPAPPLRIGLQLGLERLDPPSHLAHEGVFLIAGQPRPLGHDRRRGQVQHVSNDAKLAYRARVGPRLRQASIRGPLGYAARCLVALGKAAFPVARGLCLRGIRGMDGQLETRGVSDPFED